MDWPAEGEPRAEYGLYQFCNYWLKGRFQVCMDDANPSPPPRSAGLVKMDKILSGCLKMMDFVQSERGTAIVTALETWITSESKRSESIQSRLARIETLLETHVEGTGRTTSQKRSIRVCGLRKQKTPATRPGQKHSTLKLLVRLRDTVSRAFDKIIYKTDSVVFRQFDAILAKYVDGSLHLDDLRAFVRALGYSTVSGTSSLMMLQSIEIIHAFIARAMRKWADRINIDWSPEKPITVETFVRACGCWAQSYLEAYVGRLETQTLRNLQSAFVSARTPSQLWEALHKAHDSCSKHIVMFALSQFQPKNAAGPPSPPEPARAETDHKSSGATPFSPENSEDAVPPEMDSPVQSPSDQEQEAYDLLSDFQILSGGAC